MPSRVDKHPIAICGVALRLPGDLNSAEKLWNALRDGKDMRGLIPASRYSRAGFDSSLGSKGAIKTQYGYFLNQDVSAFDSSQFSLTEDEIKRTDPQQRLLLEVVEECFENAGETTYRGRDIACYVGAFAEDWLQVQSREDQHSGGYVMSGQIDLMLANRVSYEYDLRGPSMVIKTGCSASLIALHEACRALQMKDCDGAIVAGSNLILGPNLTAAMTTEGILSPEGSCKTFDIKADGFARGEAITAVYLQRLDQAIENRLPIRAIITNTGTNSDGRSQGLLQPSSEAQISLMRKVHGAIDSKPNRTAFVECHGTGTPTGDPIETAAVGQVFGSNSNKSGVYIGSIKPNIGHSEGASGISSLLKAILMLEKGMIVPNIKFDSPNPKIEFERFGLKVPREVMPWPRDRDMRVAINSFGIGGSNAHIIVEHPYTHLSSLSTSSWRNGISFRAPQLLLLSASTSNSVQQMSTEYKNYIEEHESDCLPDVAYTLALRREHRQYRTFAVFHEDNEDLKTAPIRKSPSAPPGIIMVFTGQGAQWAQMGHELLNDSPEFLRAIQHMDQILLNLKIPPKWSIQSEIRKPLKTSQVNRAEISQPLCTAIQVALVCMLVAAGIKPQAVAGHSSGEIAAAYAAGLMTMEVAIVIAYYRGLVTNYQTLNGGMAAIGLSSGTTQSFLKPGVVIACENSPNSTTISGDGDTVDAILEDIKRHHEGVLARRLKVDMAYHSHHMYGLSNRYVEMLRIELKSGEKSSQYMVQQAPVPMFSSVNNQVIMSREILSPEYWCANLTSPVRFSSAISNLLRDQKNNLFLELGPHSALSGPLREICASAGVSNNYCPTLIRSSHSTGSMLTAFGTLYQHGIPVKWDGVILDGEVVTDLPVYPWNHSASHWYESRASQGWRLRKFGHHELLGLRVPQTTDNDPVWRVMLNIEDVPWLVDHQVNGGIVFPFAGYACMAGEAFRQIGRSGEPEYRIRNVKIITAMVLDETRPLEIVTSLHGRSDLKNEFGTADHVYEFAIASYTGSTWIQHCTGQVGAPRAQNTIHGTTTESLPRKVAVKTWYGELSRLGLRYGPSFRRVQTLTTSTKGMLAVASISTFSDDFEENGYGKVLHATSIDASLQVGIAALSKGLCRNLTKPRVPVAIEELEVLTGTPSIHCTASYSRVDELISIDGVRDDGRSCLHLRGLKLKELDDQADLDEDNMYGAARLEWVADYDFQDISSLVKVPPSANRDKEIIEELALLCVVESVELVQDLTPSEPYLVTYRQWLERVANEAFNNQHPVLKNTRDLVSLSNEDRNSKISQLCIEACSSPLTSAFAEGTMRIREHIRQLFTGEADALELLLQENNLARIYDSISFDYADFICTLSDTVPNLRILEIGAGTGGTAELILRGMQQSPGQFPRYSQYTFSDISAGFFPKARERFAGVPNMDFKVLDISQDPIQQGFEPESYDLIIAANVVHATPSLSQTLRNLYPLLKKTGQLVLTEFCTYFRAPNYIYGNFVGWWLGEEDDRKWEPYVDTDRWDRELQAVGFSGATDVIFDAQKPFQYCATIVTRKPAEAIQLTNKVSILCENPETPLNRGLLEDLTRRGLDAKICALSLEPNLKEGDIIATLDLEEGFFENITEENFTLFQNLCRTLNGRNLLWLMPSAQINCVNPRSSQCLGLLRSARSELDISITTLELDLSVPDIATLILGIFSKVRAQKDSGTLAPDREFAVHENVLKVGRYRPFNLYEQGHSKALLDGNPRTNGNFSNANEHSENLHNGAPKPSVNGFNHDNDTTSLQLGLHTTYTNGHNGHSQNGDPKPAINWSHTLNNTSSLKFDSDAAYLITGGLGGLGRAISVWMAECGAREIVFLSPSAGTKPTDQDFFTELLSMGCIPVAIRGLVQNEEDVAQAAASAKFPIKGVLHLAMHLRDEAVLDMTHDQFKTVTAPKVHGTWNLHNEFGDSLDFFVMASSLSTVINQPGQGNYNAANTFMESFCQYRHSLGLAASVLNICPIEGVGYVAENSDARRKLKSQGHCFLDERALLEFLELVIVNSRPAVSLNIDGNSIGHGCRPWVNNSHIVMGLRSEVRLDDPSNRTTWRRDRRMGAYHNYVDQDSSSASLQGTSGSELKEFISRAANEPDSLKEQASKQYLGQEIGKKLFSFIMRPEDEIDTSLSLVQVGLDSLMAIELRRWWKQTFGVDISVLEIMNSGTISGMGEVAAEGLRKMLVEFE